MYSFATHATHIMVQGSADQGVGGFGGSSSSGAMMMNTSSDLYEKLQRRFNVQMEILNRKDNEDDSHLGLLSARSQENPEEWVQHTPMSWNPAMRVDCSSVVIGRKLFIFGGVGGKGRFNDVAFYNVDTEEWFPVKTFGRHPPKCSGHTVFAVNDNKVWLFGGEGGFENCGRTTFNHTHELDINTGKWTLLKIKGEAPLRIVPQPRRGHTTVVLENSDVVLFGGLGPDRVFMQDNYFNDVFVLDTGNLLWKKVVSTGTVPSPRAGHTATLMPGTKQMVVFGGISENIVSTRDKPRMASSYAVTKGKDSKVQSRGDADKWAPFASPDVYTLDVVSYRWTKLSTVGASPGPLHGHTATASNISPRNLYVFGGRSFSNAPSSELFVLDVDNGVWSCAKVCGSVPKPRYSHVAGCLGRTLLVYGGSSYTTYCNADVYSLRMKLRVGEPEPQDIHGLDTLHSLSRGPSPSENESIIDNGGMLSEDSVLASEKGLPRYCGSPYSFISKGPGYGDPSTENSDEAVKSFLPKPKSTPKKTNAKTRVSLGRSPISRNKGPSPIPITRASVQPDSSIISVGLLSPGLSMFSRPKSPPQHMINSIGSVQNNQISFLKTKAKVKSTLNTLNSSKKPSPQKFAVKNMYRKKQDYGSFWKRRIAESNPSPSLELRLGLQIKKKELLNRTAESLHRSSIYLRKKNNMALPKRAQSAQPYSRRANRGNELSKSRSKSLLRPQTAAARVYCNVQRLACNTSAFNTRPRPLNKKVNQRPKSALPLSNSASAPNLHKKTYLQRPHTSLGKRSPIRVGTTKTSQSAYSTKFKHRPNTSGALSEGFRSPLKFIGASPSPVKFGGINRPKSAKPNMF